VHEAIPAGQDRHERAEVHQARYAPFVDPADLDVGGDQLDAGLGLAAGGTVDLDLDSSTAKKTPPQPRK
jgi:hypothetical protein